MQLEQMVYISRSASTLGSVLDVSDILEQARHHNSRNNITGALAFTDTHFVQILEGSHSSLDVLLLKLMLDERHNEIEVLDRAPIKTRTFGEWAMISPRLTPVGQHRLVQLLAEGDQSLALYRDLMAELCEEQMAMVTPPANGQRIG